MARITIDILRSNIYSIAEGISVAISQHNGGTPSYEQLWASEDEAPKLDIYYREAVGDLERNLMRWVKEASAQFDLTETGTDYKLILDMSRYWPMKLQGLLANKIQDYLVHAVTAGWLNDFEGLTIKQDYKAIAVTDISDIHNIICQRSFSFMESSRSNDDSIKSETRPQGRAIRHRDNVADRCQHDSTGQRKTDDMTAGSHQQTVAERRQDTASEESHQLTAVSERRQDDLTMQCRQDAAVVRRADEEKIQHALKREARSRRGDDDAKRESGTKHNTRLRHRDNTLERRNKESVAVRREDDAKADGSTHTVTDRREDCKKQKVHNRQCTTHRRTDFQKKQKPYAVDAEDRHDDDSRKDAGTPHCKIGGSRHRDNAVITDRHDYTDWSGSDASLRSVRPATPGVSPSGTTTPGVSPSGHPAAVPSLLSEVSPGILIKQVSPRVAGGMGCNPGHQRPLPPRKQEEKTYMTSGGMISAMQLNRSLLTADNVGKIYNVTEGFFPTNDFVEGVSDKRLQAGTNVQVVNVGTAESPVFMFDTFEAPKEEDVFIDIDESIVDKWF